MKVGVHMLPVALKRYILNMHLNGGAVLELGEGGKFVIFWEF